MALKKLSFLLLVFFLIVPLLIYLLKGKSEKRASHEIKFFDETSFNEGANKAKGLQKFTYYVTGGIVPHHLFASSIIADFFARLSDQKPNTLILLGPNHYDKGDSKVLTSLYDWNTSFGSVVPNITIINSLIEGNLVKVDESVLPEDQSISAMMPFIKYYLPGTKVVPLLINSYFNKNESEILANYLSNFVTKDTVIIASVDFSHYLTASEAKEKDATTLKVIKNLDYPQLYVLNNDYLDSPPSIGILLMTMQKLNTVNMELLYHANSGELQNDQTIPTTSYFSISYY